MFFCRKCILVQFLFLKKYFHLLICWNILFLIWIWLYCMYLNMNHFTFIQVWTHFFEKYCLDVNLKSEIFVTNFGENLNLKGAKHKNSYLFLDIWQDLIDDCLQHKELDVRVSFSSSQLCITLTVKSLQLTNQYIAQEIKICCDIFN